MHACGRLDFILISMMRMDVYISLPFHVVVVFRFDAILVIITTSVRCCPSKS